MIFGTRKLKILNYIFPILYCPLKVFLCFSFSVPENWKSWTISSFPFPFAFLFFWGPKIFGSRNSYIYISIESSFHFFIFLCLSLFTFFLIFWGPKIENVIFLSRRKHWKHNICSGPEQIYLNAISLSCPLFFLFYVPVHFCGARKWWNMWIIRTYNISFGARKLKISKFNFLSCPFIFCLFLFFPLLSFHVLSFRSLSLRFLSFPLLSFSFLFISLSFLSFTFFCLPFHFKSHMGWSAQFWFINLWTGEPSFALKIYALKGPALSLKICQLEGPVIFFLNHGLEGPIFISKIFGLKSPELTLTISGLVSPAISWKSIGWMVQLYFKNMRAGEPRFFLKIYGLEGTI